MTPPFLSYDVERCRGDGYLECKTCLRRTAPPHPDPAQQQWIKPPPIVVFVCEYLIEP